ncbi:hypothetical protein ABPG75_006074 [Micractinium tetrahymenae]
MAHSASPAGKLVCEEVAASYVGEGGIKWAIAGRDEERLQRGGAGLELGVLRCDVHDQRSVDQVVLLSLSGPYALLAEPLVEACVRLGTHYIDLSGEITWIKQMADKYHAQAAAKQVKVISACGVEAVAADLSALMIVRHMRQKLGRRCDSVTTVVQTAQGLSLGGGSMESFMHMLSRMSAKDMVAFQSPYFLLPAGAKRGSDGPDVYIPRLVRELGQWTSPYLLASADRKVVHKSDSLLSYGTDFKFAEAMYPPGPVTALLGALANALLVALMAFRLLHPLLRLFSYRPGQGPQYDLKASWKYLSVGRTEEAPGTPQRTVHAIMGDARDPGYWGTARIVLEAALCLALDEAELRQEEGALPGGVLTPAAGLGMVLVLYTHKDEDYLIEPLATKEAAVLVFNALAGKEAFDHLHAACRCLGAQYVNGYSQFSAFLSGQLEAPLPYWLHATDFGQLVADLNVCAAALSSAAEGFDLAGASMGRLAAVEQLFAAAPESIRQPTPDGDLAIHGAARMGHAAVVRYLLEAAPDSASAAGEHGRLPLHEAAWQGHVDTVTAILACAANTATVPDLNDRLPLHWAATHGNQAVVTAVLAAAPAAAATVDDTGSTPVMLAARQGRLAATRILAAACPESVQPPGAQTSVLHSAVRGGHLEVARFLCQAFPHLAAVQDGNGSTPLHVAALYGRPDAVPFLLAAAPDAASMTALNLCTPIRLALLEWLAHEGAAEEAELFLQVHMLSLFDA